jgi:cytochrome P450
MKSYTFANGITVPAGSTLVAAVGPKGMDEKTYENPSEFDGFRFCRLRELEGENAKFYTVNLNNEFMRFGMGPHAWYCDDDDANFSPGRFFAVNEIKLILAWTLLKYDFKTKDGKRPEDFRFEQYVTPDRKAEILFRKRS